MCGPGPGGGGIMCGPGPGGGGMCGSGPGGGMFGSGGGGGASCSGFGSGGGTSSFFSSFHVCFSGLTPSGSFTRVTGIHFWLSPPFCCHAMTGVPFSNLAPSMSRHNPFWLRIV